MTPQQITADRLASWQEKLAASNATPLALIGIGQAPHLGQLVLCIPTNGPTDAEIALVLRTMADRLSQ